MTDRVPLSNPGVRFPHPMYTGLTIAYLGGAALIDSVWPIIVLRQRSSLALARFKASDLEYRETETSTAAGA